MWDEQVEEFTDRFRMILWDLPGHGGSDGPVDRTTRTTVVRDMAAILDTDGIQRAVLIGLGLGGILSLRFWREWPARVRGMVLVGTIPGLRSAMTRTLWNATAEAQAEALETAGLAALEGGAEVDPRLHASADSLAKAARQLLPEQDEGALPWLSTIDVPVLILSGGEDRPTLSAAAHMARTIPEARSVVVPRANHAVTSHKPDAANAAIRAFLARLPP